jgi:hypothetical protein
MRSTITFCVTCRRSRGTCPVIRHAPLVAGRVRLSLGCGKSKDKAVRAQMQTVSVGAVQLTGREVRSLRALRTPDWWQSGFETVHRTGIETTPNRFQSFRIAPDLLPALKVQYLWRHRLNPKALVGVDEHGTFVHLPGVGTHWRTNGHAARIFEQKFLLFRAFWQGFGWLLSTHPRRLNRYRKTLLPYLPPSRALSYPHEAAAGHARIPPVHERHANDHERIEDDAQEAGDGAKKKEAS